MWTLHSAISMGNAEHATLESGILKIAAVATGCALTWNPSVGCSEAGLEAGDITQSVDCLGGLNKKPWFNP